MIEFRIKITRQDRPHNNVVSHFFYADELVAPDFAVRRPEELRIDVFGCQPSFVYIIAKRRFKAVGMVKGVVAGGVAAVDHLLVGVGVQLHIIPDAKEGGFKVEPVECIEHKGSDFGMGTIVEREENLFFVGFSFPYKAGIKRPDKGRSV